MGSMICCSSLEGKYEEKDMENDNVKHSSEEDGMRSKTIVIQQPVLSRASSHQTLAPPIR